MSNILNNTTNLQMVLEALQNKAAGGNSDNEDGIIDNTLISYFNNRVSYIRSYAFYRHNIKSVNFPACTKIGQEAFGSCYSLVSINFPVCQKIYSQAFYSCEHLNSAIFPKCLLINDDAFNGCNNLSLINFPICSQINKGVFEGCFALNSANFPCCIEIGSSAFYSCSSLTLIELPVCTIINNSAFYDCTNLPSVNFPVCKRIGNFAFYNCRNLSILILGNSSLVQLGGTRAFDLTPMSVSTLTGSFGSIYVPASLVASYKAATNWAVYANRIAAIPGSEEGGESGGDTGEPEVGDFTFYIDGFEYQANEGMTWEDWVDSIFNTDGYSASLTGAVYDSNGYGVYEQAGLGLGPAVRNDQLIVADNSYKTA